jgi:hypothetical protein
MLSHDLESVYIWLPTDNEDAAVTRCRLGRKNGKSWQRSFWQLLASFRRGQTAITAFSCPPSSPLVNPEIDDVVKKNIGKDGAFGRTSSVIPAGYIQTWQ